MPQQIVGQRRCELNEFLRDRVHKRYVMGQQINVATRIAACRTILQIAFDGAAHLGQLTPNLVVSACEQVDFQQMIVLRSRNELVVQDGLLRPRHFVVIRITLVLLLVFEQPVCERCLGLRRTILRDGPIGLVHLARPKHVVQPRQCFRCFGKHHQARHGTVETMHHAEVNIPRLVVLFANILPHNVREWHIARLVALNDFATLLVDNNNVIIFVNGYQNTMMLRASYMFIPPSTWITCPET